MHAWNNGNGSFSVTLASGKNRKVCAIVVDKAGNSSGKVCSSSYNVDGVKPTISLTESSTSGENGWVKKATITGSFNDTVSGLASAKYCRSSQIVRLIQQFLFLIIKSWWILPMLLTKKFV